MGHLLSKRKFNLLPYILILPALALIIVFRIYPIVTTLIESFYVDGRLTLSVFARLFRDDVFWNSLWITVKMIAVMIPYQVFVSFIMALLVSTTVRGIGVFRTIIFLPFTISIPISAVLWNLMLNPNSGIINSLLGIFGIPQQGFLIDTNQALWSIVGIASWIGCAYWMIFLLAGLKNIDQTIYESARIDGANWLRTIISITLPLLKRVLLFVFVANTTANVLLFVPMQILTGGGPQGSTNVLMFEAYRSAFRFADRPRSSAIVLILLMLIVVIIVVQFRLLDDKDDDRPKRKRRQK